MLSAVFREALQVEVLMLQAQVPDLAAAIDRAGAILLGDGVFVEDTGLHAMVRSQSDPTLWHVVNGFCDCKASQFHRKPACAHRLALRLYQRVSDRIKAEDIGSMLTPAGQTVSKAPQIPADQVVLIQGKPFVRFAGLLAMAHGAGLVSLETTVVQCTPSFAVCQSTARLRDGRTFTDVGDASPESAPKHLAPHVIRLAATRATARALRRAMNISACSVEELGSEATDTATA